MELLAFVIISALTALVVSVATNLVSSEVYDWAPRWAERIVQAAVGMFHPDLHERLEGEWLADLDVIPGKLSKVLYAARIWIDARTVMRFLKRAPQRTFSLKRYLLDLQNHPVYVGITILIAGGIVLFSGFSLLRNPTNKAPLIITVFNFSFYTIFMIYSARRLLKMMTQRKRGVRRNAFDRLDENAR